MLYKKYEADDIIWGIWRFDESVEELENMLGYKLENNNSKRQQEQLVVRVLIKTLLNRNIEILYKESGKPYLTDGLFISVSHTKNYAAVSLSSKKDTGIDIEAISDKVIRVRKRFISDSEYICEDNELIHLLIHWAAKESLFKIVDQKTTKLNDDFILSPFSPSDDEGYFFITDSIRNEIYRGQYFVEKDFVLTII